MSNPVEWILLVWSLVAVIPPLAYLVARMARLGWHHGNQAYRKELFRGLFDQPEKED